MQRTATNCNGGNHQVCKHSLRRRDDKDTKHERAKGSLTMVASIEELPPILTTLEACKLLRVSRSTLYAEIRSGNLPAIRLGKRILRLSRYALERWIEQQGVHRESKEKG